MQWKNQLGSLWTALRAVECTADECSGNGTELPLSRGGVGLSEKSNLASLSGMTVVPVKDADMELHVAYKSSVVAVADPDAYPMGVASVQAM